MSRSFHLREMRLPDRTRSVCQFLRHLVIFAFRWQIPLVCVIAYVTLASDHSSRLDLVMMAENASLPDSMGTPIASDPPFIRDSTFGGSNPFEVTIEAFRHKEDNLLLECRVWNMSDNPARLFDRCIGLASVFFERTESFNSAEKPPRPGWDPDPLLPNPVIVPLHMMNPTERDFSILYPGEFKGFRKLYLHYYSKYLKNAQVFVAMEPRFPDYPPTASRRVPIP